MTDKLMRKVSALARAGEALPSDLCFTKWYSAEAKLKRMVRKTMMSRIFIIIKCCLGKAVDALFSWIQTDFPRPHLKKSNVRHYFNEV